jgi:translocation and assembly module TamA
MTRRGTAPALALGIALCVGLGGCAGLSLSPDKPGPADAATPAPAGERAAYALEVGAPKELRALLTNYLDLARFQNAPETEAITSAELDRLVAAAATQARALLETEGYFNAEVHVTREAGAGGMPLVRVNVEPGVRAVVAQVSLDAIGELNRAAEAHQAAALDELASLRRQWPLAPGQPFRQSAWNDAKNATIARLRAEGYPAASWNSTGAQVDAQNNSVQLHLVADSGPLFHLGALRIDGLQRYDEASVRHLSTVSVGEPYSEKALLDFQERLQRVGLFEGAVVEIDPDPANAAAAPVLVRVKELPLQQTTIGAGYSANTGPRVTLEHVHRRVFGSQWIAKNKFEFGPLLKSWQGELTSHPLDGLYRNLVSGSAEQLRSADQVRNSWSARIGRAQETTRIERLVFAELTHSQLQTSADTSNNDAVSGNFHWTKRALDSVLLPTRGYTLATQSALGFARSTTDENGSFVRAYGRLTVYRPLGAAWYATARVEAGQVFSKADVGVPDTLLFRAGGDDSVRGYAYRTLGPTVDGAVVSGRVLMTGSAEVARPISARLPAFWWALFVDAGNAAGRWKDLQPALGYGVGLRWRSPVGPLRVDLAYGQEVRKARLHLSVGIAL